MAIVGGRAIPMLERGLGKAAICTLQPPPDLPGDLPLSVRVTSMHHEAHDGAG
ncbi:MAG: hypothetical protein WD928_10995 [Gammaproteobacteria bacterium]